MLSDFVWVKRLKLGHIGDGVGELTDTRENTGAVSFLFSALLAHAEFNSEPVDGC